MSSVSCEGMTATNRRATLRFSSYASAVSCCSISKGLSRAHHQTYEWKMGLVPPVNLTVMDTTAVALRKDMRRRKLPVHPGAGILPEDRWRPVCSGFVDGVYCVLAFSCAQLLTAKWICFLAIRSLYKSFYLVIRLHFGVNCNRLGIVSQTRVRSESSDKWGRHCCFEHLRRGEWIYQEWKRRAC